MGSLGDDTYVFGKNSGTMIINETSKNVEIVLDTWNDTLKLEYGIYKNDITFYKNHNDLVIKINTTENDYVVVKNWQNELGGIEKIAFSDGEILNIDKTITYEQITNYRQVDNNTYVGFGEDDSITASNGNTIQFGGGKVLRFDIFKVNNINFGYNNINIKKVI